MGAKQEDGDEGKYSGGLVKERGCTDIACLIIFLAFWGLFAFVTLAGFKDGDPTKLYKPRDFRGDYCGVKEQWNEGLDLEGQEQLTYTMNVSESVDLIAKQLVCSSAAETSLRPLLTLTQLSTYRCACCLDACISCQGSLPIDDLTSAGSLSSAISGKMGGLTGMSSAASLFSSSGFNGDFMSNVWKEATKYFNAVCLEKCETPHTDISSIVPARTYVYSPSPDVHWKKAWDVLAGNQNVDATIRETIRTAFTFKALPASLCPYEARYCVPFPGVTFEELSANYCTFKMAAEVVASVGSAAGEAYEKLGASDLVSNMGDNLGDAVGDFMETLDAFAIVCVLTVVIGVIFLVMIRFLIGCAVWCSILGVFVLLGLGGGILFVRSSQCKGAALLESGKMVANSATQAGVASVTGGTAAEGMTGDGKDYRGSQQRTRSGKTCQRWNSQSPHNHTSTPANYPNSGLAENNCRNPESAPTIWCFTTDPEMRWELCTPIGVVQGECPQGYAVGETYRTILEVMAYIVWGLAGLWLIVVCCLRDRIRLAISITKVAAQFVYSTPSVLIVPLVQIFIGIAWCFVWAFCASFLLSQVPDDYTPMLSYATYAEAYGTTDTPGACTDKWPTGFTWKYPGNVLSANDPCSGNLGDTTGIVPRCWKCAPPRYMFDYRFAVSFFSYLWNAAFLIALGQCTIAGAVGIWYFAPPADKGIRGVKRVRPALWNCFRYHLGSLAFGSFILALVQFIRYLCKYFEEQAKAQKNRAMVIVLKVVQCCIWCIEKCIKFLNKNAYIQIALVGKSFCPSAKNAFSLWVRNFVRFGVVAILGTMIRFLGITIIMASSAVVGYFILQALSSDASPIVPMLAYITVAYLVAALFMNVYGLAIDTILHCFFASEKMTKAERGGDDDFMPAPLQAFLGQCDQGHSKEAGEAAPKEAGEAAPRAGKADEQKLQAVVPA